MSNKFKQLIENYKLMIVWKIQDLLEILKENKERLAGLSFIFIMIFLFFVLVRSTSIGGSANVFFKCDTDLTKQGRSIFCNSKRADFPFANLSFSETKNIIEKPKHDSSILENEL